MRLDRVGRKTNQLDTTLGEFRLKLGKGAQLSSANGSVILGVGEEDNPAVPNEFVEVDRTCGSFGLEVGGNTAKAKSGQSILAGCSDRTQNHKRLEFQMGRINYLLDHVEEKQVVEAYPIAIKEDILRQQGAGCDGGVQNSTAGRWQGTYGTARSVAMLSIVGRLMRRFVEWEWNGNGVFLLTRENYFCKTTL
jgi:hypothetical protein